MVNADEHCVSGSLDEAALVTKGKLLHDPPLLASSSAEHNAQQRIYPNISFNCSGKIRGILFAALEGPLVASQHPEVQLWREGGPSLYSKVAAISLAGATRADGLNLYHVTLEEPVLFKRGDGIGLYLPPRDSSRHVIQFQEVEAEVLVRSYSSSQFSLDDSVFDLNDSRVMQDEDIPMMIIESGE